MGMYDYLFCYAPLPDRPDPCDPCYFFPYDDSLCKGPDCYQTKSFRSELIAYQITPAGFLLKHCTLVETVQVLHTGVVNFYTSHASNGKSWVEYYAIFVDGKLTEPISCKDPNP